MTTVILVITGSCRLSEGFAPDWAYAWGEDRSGYFANSRSCHFRWLDLRGTRLGLRGLWWCEVSELPPEDEMETIQVVIADPPMENLIRGSPDYRARMEVLRWEAERKREDEARAKADEAALRADMAANPEKYARAREESERHMKEMMERMSQRGDNRKK